ncbi:MAG: hypothetical protein CO184_01630 [Candidatus Zambryskibacteria bacterium CG_4_9_14_3_um_filter_40_16]|uniref:Transcriptional regulator n=2 Tax=Candidatus Zambryskiibacteriota TaxID=1817925 RepID=A0A2H0K7A7_9BACT|nr:MAG: hypothetical protein COV95_00315 [Candidatus Zambryskibacteria bacterium CG11_big_fil_rev_8_21_14_0_20_40_24]PJA33550.1 MAG: hypothetical protein CO184_01630 [Candidatus Zambryskibacteria bacterium CG_4_9_14_3_um_filter_40_16]
MDTLNQLFGSTAKVKTIKLFLFNPKVSFDINDIAQKTKEPVSKIRKEISTLLKLKLIKKKTFYKQVEKKVRKKKVLKRVRVSGWLLNENFGYTIPLQAFLVTMNNLGPKDIVKKISKAGSVKFIAIAGAFIQDGESRVDLLVVGDRLKRGILDSAVRSIESEFGRELKYAVFETSDFEYRLNFYDKLIRDVLENPHEKILNKLGVT